MKSDTNQTEVPEIVFYWDTTLPPAKMPKVGSGFMNNWHGGQYGGYGNGFGAHTAGEYGADEGGGGSGGGWRAGLMGERYG